MQNFYVDKSTSTPADTLLAFGFADFLQIIVSEKVGNNLKIIDASDCYRIEIDEAITEEQIQQTPYQFLFRAIFTGKAEIKLPPEQVKDYKAQRDKNSIYFDAKKSGLDEDELIERGFTPPPPKWNAWALINIMSADYAFNGLTELWYAHREYFPSLVHIILEMFSTRPNDVEKAIAKWKKLAKETSLATSKNWSASQLQVINPGMGKGGNKTKASGTSVGGLKGFWILEYLKFSGFFQAALPRNTQSGDRKTYILQPKELRWETHQRVFPKFQKKLYTNTAIKLDILATLYYCSTFIQQWKAGQEDGGLSRFARANPGDHISAIETVFYKDMGSAYAAMNQSTLVLPNWIKEVKTLDDANKLEDIFDEHQRIIRNSQLDEKKGHIYNSLRAYRDFISARDLRSFFHFFRGYNKFVMGELNAKTRFSPPRFTTTNLEVLFMSHNEKLAPILESEGFLHLADAIRLSTVIPQYQKSQGKKPLYEIRYGLGDNLLRNAQYSEKFIQALSKFMHDYNRENTRKSETRGKQFRKNITTEDINDIVGLVDQFNSSTVANLLVAYGYARSPKKTTDEEN